MSTELFDVAEALGLESSPVPSGERVYEAEVERPVHIEIMHLYTGGNEVICGAVVCKIVAVESALNESETKRGCYHIGVSLRGLRYSEASDASTTSTINEARAAHEPPLPPLDGLEELMARKDEARRWGKDEARHDDVEWLVREYGKKDPVEHDFGKWLGLEPIKLEPGMKVFRVVHTNQTATDLVELYYTNQQQFRAGEIIVSIQDLVTIDMSDKSASGKTFSVQLTLEVKQILPGS